MPRNLVLTSVVALMGLGAAVLPVSSAQAQDAGGRIYYYNLTPQELNDDAVAWKNFAEYENREPCQHYWAPPAGFVVEDCRIYRLAAPPAAQTVTPQIATKTVTEKTTLLPIVSSYTLLFNFDRSNIRADQQFTLERITNEIEKYHPAQVTVSGYTDTVGTVTYNMALSQKRAKTVAKALTAAGVQNQVIDKKAYGEEDQAVQTKNDIRNQDNRRVVVDFRR